MIKAFVWIRPRKKLREASAFRGAGFPPIYGFRGLMVLRVFPFFFPLYFLPDFPYFHFIIFHPLYFLSQSIIPPFLISSPNFITSSLIPPHFTPQIQALPPLGVYETRLQKIEVGNGGLFSVTSFRIRPHDFWGWGKTSDHPILNSCQGHPKVIPSKAIPAQSEKGRGND